jgi:hypothetical protein
VTGRSFDTIHFQYPLPDGETCTTSGTLRDAAEQFRAVGVLLIKEAADAGPMRAVGDTLIGPMTADPKFRSRLDMYEWERTAGLARYQLFKTVFGSAVMAVLRCVFDQDRLLIMEHNLHRPRVQLPDSPEEGLPFHQDGAALGTPMVRGWFLLSPTTCGSSAPNIEFLVGAPNKILPIEPKPESKTYAWLEMSHSDRDQLLSSCVRWHPSVDTGDALIFRGTTPHRTHFPPGATSPRLSLETTIYPLRDDLLEFCLSRDSHGVFIVGDDRFEHIKRLAL